MGVEVELHGSAAAGADEEKPPRRRGGWLRRMMVPRECVHGRQQRWWKLQAGGGGGGSSSRLAAGLTRSLSRWKTAGSGGWATAVADAVAFRVMYVVEAVVLGLALSCFFLCCGCHL